MTAKLRIVCNTGPLIALGILNLEHVLADLFAPVIPGRVLDELRAGDESWHFPVVHELADANPDPLLISLLDTGEAAVIAVALQQNIPLVLMDEKKGRKIARRIYHLKTIGTARLLVEARRQSLVPPLPGIFSTLKSASYWIGDEIVGWAVHEAGD